MLKFFMVWIIHLLPLKFLILFQLKAGGDRDDAGILGELRRLEISRGLDPTQKMKVLLEGLINVEDPKKVAPQYAKYSSLFVQVYHLSFPLRCTFVRFFPHRVIVFSWLGTTLTRQMSCWKLFQIRWRQQFPQMAQASFILFPWQVAVVVKNLLNYTPLILQTLYEADVLGNR